MVQYNKLITANGQPQYGLFNHPIREINYADFDYHTVMDNKANPVIKHFHFNQFQFIGLLSEDFILGCALVDLKYVSNAFVYLYDRKTNELDEYSFIQPLGVNTKLSTKPDLGVSSFKKGRNRFLLEASEVPRERKLKVTLKDGITIDIRVSEPEHFEPLAICTKTGYNGWAYTQKAPTLLAKGSIRWKEKSFEVSPKDCLGSYDWSCGYMRRETSWNWGSLSGFTREGDIVGFNLATGVNETSFTENGFWVNGKLHKVNQVHFEYDRKQRLQDWKMYSDDGKVNVRFEADGQRSERLNLVVLASNFTQMFGRYYGELTTNTGEIITLDGQPGFAEDHYAKW